MPLEIRVFDAAACGFPRPRVPLLPDGCASFSFRPLAKGSYEPGSHFRNFTRGRYALREAFRLAGIGPEGSLLAPSYHCLTMIDPALALNASIHIYPLHDDLSPDLGALDQLADNSSLPVKALLVTHFFGFPQRLQELLAWCAASSVTLVEDCSHVLFTEHQQAPGTGLAGDFVVSSPYKFLPIPDGGLLYSRQMASLAPLVRREPPLAAEIRGLVNTISRRRAHRASARACDPAKVDAELAATLRSRIAPGIDTIQPASCSGGYQTAAEGLAALRLSRLIGRHENGTSLAKRRREHYRRWNEGLTGTPGCRPLHPELPDDCIPYMFPLLIDHPQRHFYVLKHMGVPVWRWDSIAVSACPVANDYRFRLLHLPCHQSLDSAELDWMIAATHKVLSTVPGDDA